jgi:hypothetical protein
MKHELSQLEAAQQAIIDLQAQLITMQKDNATLAKLIQSAELGSPRKDREEFGLPAGIDKYGTQWYTSRQYLEIKQNTFIDMSSLQQKRLFIRFTELIAHLYQTQNLGDQDTIDFGTGDKVHVYSPYDFPLLETAWKQVQQEILDEKAKAIAAKYKR